MEHNLDPFLSLMNDNRTEKSLIPTEWKARAKAAEEKKAKSTEQMDLFFVPSPLVDTALAVNVFARSAIFGIGRSYGTPVSERKVACYLNDVDVTIVGPELTQQHYNVLLTLTQCSGWARVPAGETLVMSRYALLRKGLNWHLQSNSYEKLHEILNDLNKTKILITDKRKNPKTQIPLSGISFGLLNYSFAETSGGDQLIRINLDKGLAAQYRPSLMHLTSMAQREQLGSKSLALFLHSKLSSHTPQQFSKTHPISIASLHELSGSKQDLRKFKYELKKALEELVKVEFLEQWSFLSNEQFIAYERKLSGSQAAYWKKLKKKGIAYADEGLNMAIWLAEQQVDQAEEHKSKLKELAQELKEARFERK